MITIEKSSNTTGTETWPELPFDAWQDTFETLLRWMQIVGKIRLTLTPLCNHWWNVPFYLTVRGLTTSPMPYNTLSFQMDFDFIDHQLLIETMNGSQKSIALYPRSVADFYNEVMSQLKALGINVSIWPVPVEIENRIPFDQDKQHASYDSKYVHRFWQILVQVDRILKEFRSRFRGKVSPVHFFWGAGDLAVTRFSGRQAPEHPGVPNVAKYVMSEAYCEEVSSCGFWPGAGLGVPAFYSYAYPEPDGFKDYKIQPDEAYSNKDIMEFILPYDAVRKSSSPDETLLAFLQSTYEAAANLSNWDRMSLEHSPIKIERSNT